MCGPSEHAQPPYFYLLWVSVHMSAALKGQTKKRYCLVWDGRPVCSPGSWSGRGWLPPLEKVEWHSVENGLSRKNCKTTFENLQKSKILSTLYRCLSILYYNPSLPCHLWMANIIFFLVVPHFCSGTSLLWCVLTAVVSDHLSFLSVVALV